MSIVAVGVDHRSAPLSLLERMTVPAAGLDKALVELSSSDHLSEVVLVSTCNRTEVYAVCEGFHPAVDDIQRFFSSLSGLPVDRFADSLTTHIDDDAAHHLFRVSAGLESAVVGESEILGQVRDALTRAAPGPRLDALFRHALEVGKRARTETAIARGTASVSHAAVQLAEAQLGSLVGRSVLVLGTGEIGVSMTTALQHAGVGEVLVANRTRQKAASLAARINATAVALHELPTALARVDVLLTATSSADIVLGVDDLAEVMGLRTSPLLVVDAAMPRDVDPAAASLDGLTLLDLDAIRTFVEAGLSSRRAEIASVEALVRDELDRFAAGASARQVAPVVTALRSQLEAIRAAELARYDGRLAGLSDEQREAVSALTRQLIAKIAHEPTVRLKEAAGTLRGQRMADALRTLFDL